MVYGQGGKIKGKELGEKKDRRMEESTFCRWGGESRGMDVRKPFIGGYLLF